MNRGYFTPEVHYKNVKADRSNAILKYIGSRVLNNNKNFLCAITGQTGAGKSWAGLAISEIYSKMYGINFDVEIHTIHTLKQLLLLIKNKDLEKKIEIGTPLLFEEPQATDGNARNWQSESNKMLSVLLSTFRNQRLVVFFTTPFITMIDKQSRMLFHAEFKIVSFNKQTKMTKIMPRFIEYNGDMEKFYKKKLIVHFAREGKRTFGREKVSLWEVPMASEDLTKQYEAIKTRFSVDLVNKLWDKLENKQEATQEKTKIELVQEAIAKYGLNKLKIAQELRISPWSLEKYLKVIYYDNITERKPESSIQLPYSE